MSEEIQEKLETALQIMDESRALKEQMDKLTGSPKRGSPRKHRSPRSTNSPSKLASILSPYSPERQTTTPKGRKKVSPKKNSPTVSEVAWTPKRRTQRDKPMSPTEVALVKLLSTQKKSPVKARQQRSAEEHAKGRETREEEVKKRLLAELRDIGDSPKKQHRLQLRKHLQMI